MDPSSPATVDGAFPVVFENNTEGRWSNAQIYVTVLGQQSPGIWSYLRRDGTLTPIDHRDADAPGHLEKNGHGYPNMSFTIEEAATLPMPPHIEGGRLYISAGSPMYIGVSADDRGWVAPSPRNPQDPNSDVYYDWYEFAYAFVDSRHVNFGGNTTQVDGFGIPLTARLQQASTGYDETIGISHPRDKIFADYAGSVGAIYKPLAGEYRIAAPKSSMAFDAGGTNGNAFAAAIDAAWEQWEKMGFTLTRLNESFDGRVVDGKLCFTKNGSGSYSLDKPTSTDVVQCAGALAPPDEQHQGAAEVSKVVERVLGAEIAAAFNRGVQADTAAWYEPDKYYAAGDGNQYAGFFHPISIDHLAYGFPYDDINSQSSVKILPNDEPPSSLTIGIGW